MSKKAFSELTEQGKKRRLNQYAKERAERGTTQVLARLVKPATIKTIAGDNKLAVFRFASYDKEAEKTNFFTASAFIKKGKDALENFYASLQKGQLVSVEYKVNNGYTNIYNLMDRSYADNAKKANATTDVDAEELEV